MNHSNYSPKIIFGPIKKFSFILGPGGVASAKPQGTAVAGPGGLAIARPVGTAIAGVEVEGSIPIGAQNKNKNKKKPKQGNLGIS